MLWGRAFRDFVRVDPFLQITDVPRENPNGTSNQQASPESNAVCVAKITGEILNPTLEYFNVQALLKLNNKHRPSLLGEVGTHLARR